LVDHLVSEARLLFWASVDRRDENVQLIIEDCRLIDEMRFVLVDLLPDQINNIDHQYRLRECLYSNRPSRDDFGVKVPVVVVVRDGENVKYVRLGHQFCVKDPNQVVESLKNISFKATCSESLIN